MVAAEVLSNHNHSLILCTSALGEPQPSLPAGLRAGSSALPPAWPQELPSPPRGSPWGSALSQALAPHCSSASCPPQDSHSTVRGPRGPCPLAAAAGDRGGETQGLEISQRPLTDTMQAHAIQDTNPPVCTQAPGASLCLCTHLGMPAPFASKEQLQSKELGSRARQELRGHQELQGYSAVRKHAHVPRACDSQAS